MEPADVAQVVFELTRTNLDRVMMQYEDQLSRAAQKQHHAEAENDQLRRENQRLRRLYDKARGILLENVSKFAAQKDVTPEALPPLVKEALTDASSGRRSRRSFQTPPAKPFITPIDLTTGTSPSRSPGTASDATAMPSPVGSPAIGWSGAASSPPAGLAAAAAAAAAASSSASVKHTPIDTKARKRGRASGAEKPFVYEDVVRNKEQRAAMDGYECTECRRWHEVLRQQGLVTSTQEAREHKRKCCRHKYAYEPPGTPEGFWDLTVPDYTQAKENELRQTTTRQAQKADQKAGQKGKQKQKQRAVLANTTNQGRSLRQPRL